MARVCWPDIKAEKSSDNHSGVSRRASKTFTTSRQMDYNKTGPCVFSPISQEQKFEAAMGTDSQKLDNPILEKLMIMNNEF